MVFYHTPEIKQQSKQCLNERMPGPIKVKVRALRTKLMVCAFFDSKGLIFMNCMPRGITVNVNIIVEALWAET